MTLSTQNYSVLPSKQISQLTSEIGIREAGAGLIANQVIS
jgi:hypothetical protein